MKWENVTIGQEDDPGQTVPVSKNNPQAVLLSQGRKNLEGKGLNPNNYSVDVVRRRGVKRLANKAMKASGAVLATAAIGVAGSDGLDYALQAINQHNAQAAHVDKQNAHKIFSAENGGAANGEPVAMPTQQTVQQPVPGERQ